MNVPKSENFSKIKRNLSMAFVQIEREKGSILFVPVWHRVWLLCWKLTLLPPSKNGLCWQFLLKKMSSSSIQKVLLSYDEYIRLKDIEKNFETVSTELQELKHQLHSGMFNLIVTSVCALYLRFINIITIWPKSS